jgi:sphingomyelin phosphodiesterase
MFTGDYPAHDVWAQSREKNIQHGKVATDLVKKYFPDSTILPNIGNHEAWPCNRYVRNFFYHSYKLSVIPFWRPYIDFNSG